MAASLPPGALAALGGTSPSKRNPLLIRFKCACMESPAHALSTPLSQEHTQQCQSGVAGCTAAVASRLSSRHLSYRALPQAGQGQDYVEGCNNKTYICYKCHMPGHWARDCPGAPADGQVCTVADLQLDAAAHPDKGLLNPLQLGAFTPLTPLLP